MTACAACAGRVSAVDVECPECPADVGERCTSESTGKPRPPHARRRPPAVCPACSAANVEPLTLDVTA